MIAKVTRGGDTAGLMRYLVGPGRANEHTSPHLVWGSPGVMARWSDDELGQADARALAEFMDHPRNTYGVTMRSRSQSFDTDTGKFRKYAELRDAHVWHCSLSLAPDHRPLEDHEWSAIAQDFVDDMGFSAVDGRASTRWAAVHHGSSAGGGDHIHIAVNLVREDGTKAVVLRDYQRASAAVAAIEKKYGLEVVAGREVGRSAAAVSKQDHYELTDSKKIAERQAKGLAPRVEPYTKTLARTVRACAVASETEAEFVRRLRREDLWVRPRFAAGTQDVVVGYSIAERPAIRGEQPQWRRGSGLGKDLSLPRLRATWIDSPDGATEAAAEWRAAWRGKPIVGGTAQEMAKPTAQTWERYTADMRTLGERLGGVDPRDHATWARLAHEASGTLAAWSLRLEATPGPLAKASGELASAAQLQTRHARPPAVQGMSMRGAARLVLVAASGDTKAAQAMLLRQLVITLVAMHRAFAQTRQLRQTETLARALDVDLKQVHDTLAATSSTPAAAGEAPAATPGAQPSTPTLQPPVPGKVAKSVDPERPGVVRPGAGRGRDGGPER